MLINNKKAFKPSIFLAKPSIMLVQFHCTSSKQLTRTFLLPSSLPASSVFPLIKEKKKRHKEREKEGEKGNKLRIKRRKISSIPDYNQHLCRLTTWDGRLTTNKSITLSKTRLRNSVLL